MYKISKKTLAVLLMFLLLWSNLCLGYAASTDTAGHWAQKNVDHWVSMGLIKGYPDGTFKPDDSITRAEFVKLLDNVFRFVEKAEVPFGDVEKSEWYAESISKAYAAGIIKGSDGRFKPDSSITRQEAAVILSRAFNLKATNTASAAAFSDSSRIADWAVAAISALSEKAYVQGRDGKRFAPEESITRAETITMINNIMGELKYQPGTYTDDVAGNLTVNTADVVLKDMTVKGDLILTQGIGSGEVNLDNVTVQGSVLVQGGGENSIKIKNSSVNGTLVVWKQDGKVRIVASGTTEIANVELWSGAKVQEENVTGKGFQNITVVKELKQGEEIKLDGNFAFVAVQAPQASIKVLSGSVEKLEITKEASGTAVEVAKEAKISTLQANAKAEVKGEGKIELAKIAANDVTMQQKPEKIEVAQGVTSDVVAQPPVPVVMPSGGGSGNSGGNTPTQAPAPGFESGYPRVVTTTATTAAIEYQATVAGVVYYEILKVADAVYSPATAQAVANFKHQDVPVASWRGMRVVTSEQIYTISPEFLPDATEFKLFAVAKDTDGRLSQIYTLVFSTEMEPVVATGATITGAKKITVEFNKALGTIQPVISIRKGTMNLTPERVDYSSIGKSAVLGMQEFISQGEYTITIEGLLAGPQVFTVAAENERVEGIGFSSDRAVLSRHSPNAVTVSYFVYNQYREDITTRINPVNNYNGKIFGIISVTASKGSVDSGIPGKIYIASGSGVPDFIVNEQIAVSVIESASGVFMTGVFTVSEKPVVSEVVILGLYNKDNKELNVSRTASDFSLVIEARDQYGEMMTDVMSIKDDVIVSVGDPSVVSVAGGTTSGGVVNDPRFIYNPMDRKLYLPLAAPTGFLKVGTTPIAIKLNITGDIAQYNVVVNDIPKVDVITLSQPELAVAGEKIRIPFTAVDQFGNAITDVQVIKYGIMAKSSNEFTAPLTFEQDYMTGVPYFVLDATFIAEAKTVVVSVVTGTNQTAVLTLNLMTPAKPVVIAGIKGFATAMAIEGVSSLSHNNIIVMDQYAREMKVTNILGSSPMQYNIGIRSSNEDILSVGQTAYLNGFDHYSVPFTALNRGTAFITLQLLKIDESGKSVGVAGSEYVASIKVVDKTDITAYEVADMLPLYDVSYLSTMSNPAPYAKSIYVTGILANGEKVRIPTSYYNVTSNTPGVSYGVVAPYRLSAQNIAFDGSTVIKVVPITITIAGANGAIDLVKEITLSREVPKPATLSLVSTYNAYLYETGVIATSANSISNISSLTALTEQVVRAVDQYGVEIQSDQGFYSVTVTNLTSGAAIQGVNGSNSTNLRSEDYFDVMARTSNGKEIKFKIIIV